MSRTTATIPDDRTDLMEGSVKAGIFENKSDAIRHVLREYFEENQNARISAAVSLYEEKKSPWVLLPGSLASTGLGCGTCCEKKASNYDPALKTWLPRETRSTPPVI